MYGSGAVNLAKPKPHRPSRPSSGAHSRQGSEGAAAAAAAAMVSAVFADVPPPKSNLGITALRASPEQAALPADSQPQPVWGPGPAAAPRRSELAKAPSALTNFEQRHAGALLKPRSASCSHVVWVKQLFDTEPWPACLAALYEAVADTLPAPVQQPPAGLDGADRTAIPIPPEQQQQQQSAGAAGGGMPWQQLPWPAVSTEEEPPAGAGSPRGSPSRVRAFSSSARVSPEPLAQEPHTHLQGLDEEEGLRQGPLTEDPSAVPLLSTTSMATAAGQGAGLIGPFRSGGEQEARSACRGG